METPLSLRTWPDVQAYDTFITDTLQGLRLSNLETEYQETNDGKDTWTLRDPLAKANLICIVVDGNLALWIEPLVTNAVNDWLCDQLTHAFAMREDVLCNIPTKPHSYLTWSMTNRSVGPTIEMAQRHLKEEQNRCPYPALEPAYPFQGLVEPQDPSDGPNTGPG